MDGPRLIIEHEEENDEDGDEDEEEAGREKLVVAQVCFARSSVTHHAEGVCRIWILVSNRNVAAEEEWKRRRDCTA